MTDIVSIEVDDRQFLAEMSRDFVLFADVAADIFDEAITELFEGWMATWHRKYAIEKKKEKRPYGIQLTTFIDNAGGKATGASPYDERRARDNVPAYLNYGTDSRFAVMTASFSPKTHPHSLKSTPGFGGSLTTGAKAQKGISAREFDVIASEQFEKDVDDMIDRAIGIVF